jgi:hypothetical protein
MIHLFHTILLATFVIFVLVVIKSVVVAYDQRRKMPPGPHGLPLLGNALQMPTTMPWLRFTEWKEKYGADWTKVSTYLKLIFHVFPQVQYSL